MNTHYSPYQNKISRKRIKIPHIPMPKGVKWWLGGLLGLIVLGIIAAYISLGPLRFFANHYLGLTFFNKHYLVVLQNNYELRPGGGFVTAYGELETLFGFPVSLDFSNSYQIDTDRYVTPPYPHEELLKNEWYEGWAFRDANWSPDGAESAKSLVKFYQEKFAGADVDGVVVMNFSVIESMVDALGGVEWNGKTLTKNNLFNELEFEVNNIDRHNVEALNSRKNVVGELGKLLMSKAKWSPLITRNVIADALDRKDMYLWMQSERLQRKLTEKGWTNTLEPIDRGDFLAINLANLGAKKADRYIHSEVDYFANLKAERPYISAEVTLRYPGSTSIYSDNYRGYLRILIPKKAELDEYPVDSKLESFSDDLQSVGTIVRMPAGSKTTLTYRYFLPRSSYLKEDFTTRMIKQSGAEMLYKITMETRDGILLHSDQMETRENRAMWFGTLKNDRDFTLTQLADTTPAYPIAQSFKSLSVIEIIWSELLAENTVIDVNNFEVIDLNVANQETDELKVVLAELTEPNRIELELAGITPQPEEHFQITLKNIKDRNGNTITPNPKTITVVQRLSGVEAAPEINLGTIELEELVE